MFQYLQGEVDIDWIFGQADCSKAKRGYGHYMEDHSVGYLGYTNGARGLLDGGKNLALSAAIRIIGERGMLDIHHDGNIDLWNDAGHSTIHNEGNAHNPASGNSGSAVLHELVKWLDTGIESSVSAQNTFDGTAAALGIYESAVQQARIDWPLTSQNDSP